METTIKKKEITGISFSRVVLIVLIVFIHFLGSSGRKFSIFPYYLYPPWNSLLAVDFLMISGAVLYYNHPEVPSLKKFYFKRFKSIYVPFYLAYAYFFIRQVFQLGDLFPHGQPWCLIFTVLGIDGYAATKFPSYNLIGEWSLGVIVILYFLFPLLAKCIRRAPWLTALVILAGYFIMLKTMFLTTFASRNIFTCLMSFYFGMLVIKYENIFLRHPLIGLGSLLFLILSGNVFYLPVDACTLTQLHGFAFFFVLYYLGDFAMKFLPIRKIISCLSPLSYPLFLVHHIIVNETVGYQNPETPGLFLLVFLIALLLSLAAAKVLSLVTEAVVKSDAWKKLENRILGRA